MALLEFNDGIVPDQWGVFGNPYDIAKMTEEHWWMPHFKSAMGASLVGTDHFTRFDGDWSELGVDDDFANPTYNFSPDESMTRKEVAEMLYRMKAAKDNEMEYYNEEIVPNDLLSMTKEEAQALLEEAECFYSLDESDVSLDLEGDEWIMSSSNCGGVCSVNVSNSEVFIDVNPMCMGAL